MWQVSFPHERILCGIHIKAPLPRAMRGGGIQGGGIPLEILKNQVVAPHLNPLSASIYAGRFCMRWKGDFCWLETSIRKTTPICLCISQI